MTDDFAAVFAALRPVLATHSKQLSVKTDTATEYTLVTKSASPFAQHKGQPLLFGSVNAGKAYVSFHLMPIYMCPPVMKSVTPELKKRMQGKTCFNFRTAPQPELIADLKRLTEAGLAEWKTKNWI